MYEKIIISIIFGYIMGSCTTILLIMFRMGCSRDSKGKQREDLEGYADFMRGRGKKQ